MGKEKTAGGVTRAGLIKNKRGKIVSKRASAAGNRRYKYIQTWVKCVVAARQDRLQARLRGWQSPLQVHPDLGEVRSCGAQGSQHEGFRGCQRQQRRGQCLVCEVQGAMRSRQQRRLMWYLSPLPEAYIARQGCEASQPPWAARGWHRRSARPVLVAHELRRTAQTCPSLCICSCAV